MIIVLCWKLFVPSKTCAESQMILVVGSALRGG